MSKLTRLIHGALLHGRSVDFLVKNPAVMRWFVPPMVLSFALYGAFIVWVFFPFREGLVHFLSTRSAPDGVNQLVLELIVGVIFALFAAVFVGATFSAVFFVLAGPFLESMSAEIEGRARGYVGDAPDGITAWIRSAWFGVRQGFGLLCCGLLALPLGLIPVIGMPLVTVWVAFSLAFVFADIPFSRRVWRFRRKLRFLARDPWRLLGMGLPMALIAPIPMASLFLSPIYVVSGTLLFMEIERESEDI